MREDQKAELADLLADAMSFYKQNLSDFALSVWWNACQRYDVEQVRKALSAHVMDPDKGQFPPKPADLVRALEGTATDKAMLAWGKVFDAMQRVGAYTDVVFDDPAIHAVLADMGGWPKVCRTELKELSYLQHRFTESYRAYSGREAFEYPRRLVGDRSADEQYERRGLPAPKPAVIGDVVRARLVYQGGKTGSKPFSLQALEAASVLIGNAMGKTV